jgi:hypothetical protein
MKTAHGWKKHMATRAETTEVGTGSRISPEPPVSHGYYDFGNGPAPESLKDEAGSYRKVAGYFLFHPQAGRNYLAEDVVDGDSGVGFEYAVQICDVPHTMAKPECEAARKISLSPDYYKGDRSMRESGFDISFRFGPYGAATHHYAPICLNSLLYKTEKDLQAMGEILGRKDDALKAAARGCEKGPDPKISVGSSPQVVLRLRLRNRGAVRLRIRNYLLSAWAGLATPE